jgi:hypothetical protein
MKQLHNIEDIKETRCTILHFIVNDHFVLDRTFNFQCVLIRDGDAYIIT